MEALHQLMSSYAAHESLVCNLSFQNISWCLVFDTMQNILLHAAGL